MKEINLFQIHRKIAEKEAGVIRKAKIISLLLLIFYCLVATGIFSFWLILKRQNEAVVSKIKYQKQRINELNTVESLHIFVKQRLSALSPLFEKETIEYKETLTQLEELLPEGVVLTKIELVEEGSLELSGEAPNAVIFADFLERLLASGNEEFAESVEMSSTSRQEDGSYKFSLNVNVKI